MAIPDTGPCKNWSPDPACYERPEGATPALEEFALQVATEVLWERSGRRYGLCDFTLRPCRDDCLPAQPWIPQHDLSGASWPFPALVGGAWINIACGFCSGTCSCSRISQVTLPYPVAEIQEVKLDGAVFPAANYRVDDWRFLVRVDGGQWPRCNDLTKDDNQPGTWSVTASYGEIVPSLGSLAVAELASEVMKACLGDKGCKLQARVREVTRQGVTKRVVDDALGRDIGLRFSDLFIETVNPAGIQTATITDIDKPQARRVGT